MQTPSPSRARLITRALRLRCPCCGGRGLFHRWYRMQDRCPTCGLATDRVVGHWIGAVGINTMVSFGALAIVLFTSLILSYPEIRVVPVLTVAVATAVLVPLIFWPVSQTLWTAIDIMMRPVTPDELDPRYLGR